MDSLFDHDYDLSSLIKVKTKGFDFDFYITPRFTSHYVENAYERFSGQLIRQNGKGVSTFIDIGAHYGFYDVLVGLSNPRCKIIAFEPVPENCEILRRNLKLNRVKAIVHPVAVSDHSGGAELQVSVASDNSGLVANPAVEVLKKIPVDVMRLDQYREQISSGPVLIKMDVDGHEPQVLDGMKGIIGAIDDLRLLIEFNPPCLAAYGSSPEALLTKLDELGFDIFFIHEGEQRYEKFQPGSDWHEFLGAAAYRNLFCTRKTRTANFCFFSHSADIAGAERSLLELAGNMVATHGALCTVVLASPGPLMGMLRDRGASTIVVPYSWWCAQDLVAGDAFEELMHTSYTNVMAATSVLNKVSPDVVITNTLVIPWGAVAAWKLNRPHFWWVHEFGQLDHGLTFHYTLRNTIDIMVEASNHVVVSSRAIKQALFADLAPEKCTVATYAINALPEPVSTNSAAFRYPNSTKLVISGRVSPSKGQDDAILAVKQLVQAGHDVELCILGDADSPFGTGLKRLVESERLSDRVHFVGFVDNVRTVLDLADVGLTCSRNEAFGRATAEAMLQGKPVIGTNTGGTVDLIDDGIDGFLYSPGNVDELAGKIAFFMKHPAKMLQFGKHAREMITQKLAANPDDEFLYSLCRANKGDPNPDSQKLKSLILEWQEGIISQYARLLAEKIQAEQQTAQRLEAEKQEAVQWVTSKSEALERRLIAEKQAVEQKLTAEEEKRARNRDMYEVLLRDKEAHERDLSAEKADLGARLSASEAARAELVAAADAQYRSVVAASETERAELVASSDAERASLVAASDAQRASLLAAAHSERLNLTDQIQSLRKFIAVKEQDIRIAASFIEQLNRSLSWRLILRLRLFLEAVTPVGSLRRRIIRLPFGFLRSLLHRRASPAVAPAATPESGLAPSVPAPVAASVETRAFCTIASKNYLSQVRVWADSIARTNPGTEVYVLLVDRVENKFDPEEEPYHLISVDELDNIPNPAHLFFKYDPLELNTAVKPYFLEYLFRVVDVQKLCYFDPDIYVFSTLEGIWGLLDVYSLVVTPHITSPYKDNRHPNELQINQAGIFNLGFLGLSKNPETGAFLEWWKDRLYDYCYLKPEVGMHVDQSWVDFAPVMHDGVFILRDPGFNIAYWNLHERGKRLRFTGDSLLIDNRPATFYHFSGFDAGDIESVSKHQDRYVLGDLPNLRPLFQWYRELLRQKGSEKVQKWTYAFGTFDNGVRIPKLARDLYSKLGRGEASRFGDPFKTAGAETFFSWLNQPSESEKGLREPVITRLGMEIYSRRPDLHHAFPDPLGADRMGFRNWLQSRALPESGLDSAFLPEAVEASLARAGRHVAPVSLRPRGEGTLYSLRRRAASFMRRRLPAESPLMRRLRAWDRRLFLDAPAVAPALAPAVKSSSLPFGVNVAGYIQGEFGVAEGARGSLKALAAAKIGYVLNNVQVGVHRHEDRTFGGFANENPFSINLVHVNADQVQEFARQKGQAHFSGRYNIGYWFWELSRFPKRWDASFDYFQEIWVATEFCQDSIATESPVPVVKMIFPVLVDDAQALPDRGLFGLPNDKFVFGFVFDYLSVFERKNPLALIEAFQGAFANDDDTLLVIKSINSERAPAEADRLRAAARARNVRLIDKHVSRGDMLSFMSSLDCFVSLHRSEGFGIGMAQAMYLGKPVVATGYSGNMEFMNHNNSFLVRYRLAELERDYGPYPQGSVWAEPDVEHAAELMRWVLGNRHGAERIATRGQTDIRTNLTPEEAGQQMKSRLMLVAPQTSPS